MSSEPSTRPIAVIDIDGVLADVGHRVHFLDRHPPDWRLFFDGVRQDPPLPQGLEIAQQLSDACDIVYLSGRPEHTRRDTAAWLKIHALPEGALHLRPHRDYRPARLFKVDVLRRLSKDNTVTVVVDDDLDVLIAVQKAGFDVLPATWAARDVRLYVAQEEEGRT